MKYRSSALWLVAAIGLVGCSKPDMPTASRLLQGAHQSLEENDTASATQWLQSARSRLETEQDRKDFELLAAELDLRSGESARALQAMNGLLEREPDNPRAHELAGKAQLRLGDFAEASRHFGFAARSYRNEADAARAADLLALSQGFEAYAGGRPEQAKSRWQEIAGVELRASVLGASDTAASRTGDNDGTFAQFYLPRD